MRHEGEGSLLNKEEKSDYIDWKSYPPGEWPTDSEDDDLEFGMRKRGRLIRR